MNLTPSQSFEHIQESVIEYLETAYRISHSSVFAERAEILRRRGTIGQAPFIEATPAFESHTKLADLERLCSDILPPGLAELVLHGVPVDRFPLYTHQEQALRAAFSQKPNLLVATGTGSGKTESFLLPILSDILREAQTWSQPSSTPRRGEYDARHDVWLHSRRHETRPAGLRAMILYPMNALVNDQLSRLRRILARNTSPDWQRRNLKENVIHFGMYTSIAQPTGSWADAKRRERFAKYLQDLVEDWERLRPDLRDTGSWPRPDSPEMLCRWDIQAAPPDILVTNYSMLEYMLIRPIEDPIFAKTRQWLEGSHDARFTLVLDEAHTYTGAKGTEVAYLVRRLKERLGLACGDERFRAIATTASLPNTPGSEEKIRAFVSDLFGEPADRFTLIKAVTTETNLPDRAPRAETLEAFTRFQRMFTLHDPLPAIKQIAEDLDLGQIDQTEEPQVILHGLLERNAEVTWVRQRTARKATLLDVLSDECWGALGTGEGREVATAGILAAGSFARASASPDTPPLLSMRLHAFFRGTPGLWACMDPHCPELPDRFRSSDTLRPLGRLYTEPRSWCGPACGARVLELFSCRKCGLLFLGGLPDTKFGSLWPWSEDLTGMRQDTREFHIFGVEQAHTDQIPTYRSTRSTLECHGQDVFARPVYEIEYATNDQGVPLSNFPAQCSRCQNYRSPNAPQEGREIIEDLRTKGTRSFSVIAENGFRVQPRAKSGQVPNYGRKALLFTDSRMEAALLAADLRKDHHDDLFRQMAFRALQSCPDCGGSGIIEQSAGYVIGRKQNITMVPCPACTGTGLAEDPAPLSFHALRDTVITHQIENGINPTNPEEPKFFQRHEEGLTRPYDSAIESFHVALRRELSETDFALEPLGLAKWRVSLPSTIGQFPGLTEEESRHLIQAATRILCTEDVLIPPRDLAPWSWPKELVKDHDRNVLFQGYSVTGRGKPYNFNPTRRLGRFIRAVTKTLIAMERLTDTEASVWLKELEGMLWDALKHFGILRNAGAKIANRPVFGIGIDLFELSPVGDAVQQCIACAYVMADTLLDVCLRCGQRTRAVSPTSLRNFYRRAAQFALPRSGFDDPYPLRAIEHTAQISGDEARDTERWFQDLFHDHQNQHDFRVDVLSVTTTMEMGIDIGSLLCVGLRNVPPTVANYQQRAGRAGRRGSSIATVLTFAQARSHDQYYFNTPPEIVSDPPRVPALYLENEVIAQRHFRSLILQDFFHRIIPTGNSNLFAAWGKVADFAAHNTADRLQTFLSANRAPLLQRCSQIFSPAVTVKLSEWMQEIVEEVQTAITPADANDDLLKTLISSGLLPKYAFPVDVVGLSIPDYDRPEDWDEKGDDAMQRDLKIAVAEYAPGAEVIRGRYPNTFIYRSVGVYDPFATEPDYSATGVMVECQDCQAIQILAVSQTPSDFCPECNSLNIQPLPYLRPAGFTVDASIPDGGREVYKGGGRERAGYAAPAQLLIGQTSFNNGVSHPPLAPRLFTYVRVGDLFLCNRGVDRKFPGFLICPDCGRSFLPDQAGPHTYPANVPPHQGRRKGPRAGDPCRNKQHFQNQVILGHRFSSEIILLGADLPDTLDAPFLEPSGRALWYSFGTLVANAAAFLLQIDPGELKVGVRPAARSQGRVHGEVFIYDDVPGGAGYARAIEANLAPILQKALALGRNCENPDCSGACYRCLYDYRNQMLHPYLDRRLGASLLAFLLEGREPTLSEMEQGRAADAMRGFIQSGWTIEPGHHFGTYFFPTLFRDSTGQQYALWVTHPLRARPTAAERQAVLAEYGVRCAVHTSFDLERRPFWVFNNLIHNHGG